MVNIRLSNGKYAFKSFNNKPLIVLDASQYFSSKNVHCSHCCAKRHNKNTDKCYTEYCEYFLAATLVSISLKIVVNIWLEFITNEADYCKQDCENKAAKRLIPRIDNIVGNSGAVFLGDDLYSRNPIISLILENQNNDYILTCKDDSHKSLMSFISGLSLSRFHKTNRRQGGVIEEYEYNWINGVPVSGDNKSLLTNYVTVKITRKDTKKGNKNDVIHIFIFIINIKIDKNNVSDIISTGRARWNIENGDFNIMKNH
jgi:hypothetical protein